MKHTESKLHSFVIKDKLITLNEYIRIERGNKFKAAKAKSVYTLICQQAANSLKGKVNPSGLYDLKIHWVVKDNKCDADNIYFGVKYILDGMVKAGVISGDGRGNIRNIAHSIETAKGQHYVTVEMVEA